VTTRNRRTSEAVVISSATLFGTDVACQAFIADAAAWVRWLIYGPRCLAVDTDVSHRRLAVVLALNTDAQAPFRWWCLRSLGFSCFPMTPL
jgi:hypothetical protein